MKNIVEMTRKHAENFVNDCDDPNQLIEAMKHKNRHVGRAAFRRGMALGWITPFLVSFAQVLAFAGPQDEEDEESEAETVRPSQMEEKVSSVVEPSLDDTIDIQLSEQYGETIEYVRLLANQKGNDYAAVKRSLISRKAARTTAARKKVASLTVTV